MSDRRSAFFELKLDRRTIRLADGTIIYSEGLGSIRFLSTYGYRIILRDVLYVPRLTTSFFSSNKFANFTVLFIESSAIFQRANGSIAALKLLNSLRQFDLALSRTWIGSFHSCRVEGARLATDGSSKSKGAGGR